MIKMVNCPNCGAPAKDQFCEYCGTPLFTSCDSFTHMQGKVCHIWFENENRTVECLDAYIHRATFDDDTTTLYANDDPYLTITTRTNVSIEGELMDFDLNDWKKVIAWQSERYSETKKEGS